VNFEVSIDIDAITYVNLLDHKSKQIIKTHLRTLEQDPFPGKGGDKELLNLRRGMKIYRIHIGDTFTAYYEIEGKTVFVNEILTIEQAHKKYKRLLISFPRV
jgi:mRNA interferase RelE/StbE